MSEEGREISFRDAIKETLKQEMMKNETVFLMGQDIGSWGGQFAVTKNLYQQFGDRILDTPATASAVIGCAIGAAISGMRPVVELTFVDLCGHAWDQIQNHLAKITYASGGQVKIPLVFRTAFGAGLRLGAQHSQTLYSIFVHIPGLKVVVPSTPYDAKGLLVSAIRDDNPVIYFEHKMLYELSGIVPENEYEVPLGKARIAKEGEDVTVISSALMFHRAAEAAKKLEEKALSVELIDLRTLAPLDEKTILKSVGKTGKAVIVDEDYPGCSVADYIAAMIADKAFDHLDAPIKKVQPPRTPVPYSPILEDVYLPTSHTILETVNKLCKMG